MAFSFDNGSPDWVVSGTEPTSDYKQAGFKAGRGLPAPYLNWLMTQISKCITELQQKSVGVAGEENSAVYNISTNTARGYCANAFGNYTEAIGSFSLTTGYNVKANDYQMSIGKFNTEYAGPTGLDDTSGTIFSIGVGTNSASANAFRVTAAGQCMGTTYFASSGADYAEFWEYADGNPNNEDRRGLFVTFDNNDKIRIANADDNYILGIVSATPSCIGDIQSDEWQGKYEKDVFGERLTETVEVEETTDEEGNVIPAHTETKFILNPDYDNTKEYKGRHERKEWCAVGLLGKLVVIDDGTCKAGSFCKVADGGKATASESGWYVMERIDDTHIRIMYK